MPWVRVSWRYRRLMCAAWAVTAFALLLAAASRLGMNLSMLGFSEDVVRGTGHLTFYGMLGVLFGYAMGGGRRWWLGVLIASAMGGAEEVYQLYVPGRYGTVGDWLTDVGGAAAFVTLAACAQFVWRRLRSARRRRHALAQSA